MDDELKKYLELTTKVIGIGANYHSYIEKNNLEVPKKPILFLKPPSSIVLDGQAIIYPDSTGQLEYEAELGVVIKTKCKNVKRSEFQDVIAGYTCINDVTARDLQTSSSQWTESKSFDTFCPIGPRLIREVDFSASTISCFVNDHLVQNDYLENMVFGVPELIEFISSLMTLFPGDVILTGTPSGSKPVQKGDKVEVRISKIGTLINYVK